MITPVEETKWSVNKLPEDVPNRLAGETRAHAGSDFEPVRFKVGVHETKEELSLSIVIPGIRHDQAN